MRLLLDESRPRRLKQGLPGHEVRTVPEMGWAGKTNGELLSLARGEFDVFLTADQNLEFQQSLGQEDVPVVVMAARSSSLDDLRPLVPSVLRALDDIGPGRVVRVTA